MPIASMRSAFTPRGSTRRLATGLGSSFRFLQPLNARKNKGIDVIHDPLWNKGTATPKAERERLGIRGLLPYKVYTIEQQKELFLTRMRALEDPVAQGLMLNDLHDRNETLYHRVILDHVEEVAPLVYTPTVGNICQRFGNNFIRPRGLYITPEDRGEMAIIMRSWPAREVSVVVATDGGRVLGLGDLGANAMGISIGKLAIYSAVGGIAPHRVLPIALDVGTNNEALLSDPGYRGWPHKRLEGEEYYTLVDEFVQALFKRYPKALLQFEDFSSHVAAPLLSKYRSRVLCFNDDIQGTGAVCVAGVLGALRIQKKPSTAIKDLKIVVVGAGSAGIGVAGALRSAMIQAGASEEQATRNFYVMDKDGLVGTARGASSGLGADVMAYAREDVADGSSLEEVVGQVRPGMILGLSGVKGAITHAAVKAMVTVEQPRPIIFPLSNPTSSAEISPEEVYSLTDGGGIVATGSPFAPVTHGGKTLTPSQCNNMYVFPGMGLGNSACLATEITEPMIYKAALAISQVTSDADVEAGRVFPGLRLLRECALNVAEACVDHALENGLARVTPAAGESTRAFIERKMYYPEYVPIYSKPEEE